MTQRRDLQALIDAAPIGKMQWCVIICCFLVVMLDGFDTAAIGFIAPDIRSHWRLTAGATAPLFGAGLLGIDGRRTALWPVVRPLWSQTGDRAVRLFMTA